LPRRRPSEKVESGVSVVDLLGGVKDRGTELGTEVHALFEKIEWWDEKVAVEDWLKENRGDASDKAVAIFIAAMEAPKVSNLFFKPSHPTEVWNEQSFAFQKQDELIKGVFDRVVLNLSNDDSIESAEIVDFKTDRGREGVSLGEMADRHKQQLEFYRLALSRITGLSPNKIRLTLLFTSRRELLSWE